MPSVFGPDMSPVVKFALILAIVLFLVGMFVVILRKLTGGRLIPSAAERNRSRQPRLGVVDIYDLDRTRQLVLLRRDNVEHLLLIGGLNDVVIETNIVRVTAGRANLPSDVQIERQDPTFEAAGRPAYENALRPVVEAGSLRHDIMGEQFAERPVQPFEPLFDAPVVANQSPVLTSSPELSPQQAAVAAASLAAVAAATQYLPQFEENVEETVPDFLKGEKRNYRTDHDFETHAQFLGSQQKQDDISLFAAEQPSYQPVEAFSNASPVIVDNFVEQPAPVSHPIALDEPVISATPNPWLSQPDTLEVQPETHFAFDHAHFVDTTSSFETAPAILETPETVYPERDFSEDRHSFAAYDQNEDYKAELTPIFEEVPEVQEEAQESQQTINLDDATLSDMARQLEEALKTADLSRSLTREEPTPTESQAPTQEASLDHPPHYAAGVTNTISGAFGYQVIDTRKISPAIETTSEPIPTTHTAVEVETFAQPIAQTKQESSEQPLQEKKSATSQDPFSLDDIEAEFARLLGRADPSNN